MVEHKGVGGVQEVAGEEIVSIEHIPANDWAAVGARLERAAKQGYSVSFVQCVVDDKVAAWASKLLYRRHEGRGETVLEALTAALDAAEGAK